MDSWAGQPVSVLRDLWQRECVHTFGSISSTNDAARELADAGVPAGSIVLCREQTAGRGREGRAWSSPAGAGLYLSMLFRPGPGRLRPLASVVAGVDVARALNQRFAGLGAAVKWPNDLMIGDRKLGGILVESAAASAGDTFIVVGIGINVRAGRLPADVPGAAALEEHDESATLVEAAKAVVEGLERRLPNPPELLDAASLGEIDRYDCLRNRQLEHIVPGKKPVRGVAAGIAPDGALLLRPAGGALRRVVTGSIVLRG